MKSSQMEITSVPELHLNSDAPTTSLPPEPINYRDYLSQSTVNWKECLGDVSELSSANLLKILLKNLVILDSEAFYNLILGFFLMPSAVSRSAPILLAHGPSGSGKSRILQFGAALYNTNILSSTSTAVSIRNQIQAGRYDMSGRETNYCLFIDDIKKNKILEADHLYAMLRQGCYRATDCYTISGENSGEIKTFRIFGPKALSSIEAFWTQEAFSELKRRALIVFCDRVEKISDGTSEILEIEEIDWTGLPDIYLGFWTDPLRLSEYANLLKSSSRNKPKNIEKSRWNICASVYATMVATEIVGSPGEAKENLCYCLEEMTRKSPKNPFEEALTVFLQYKEEQFAKCNALEIIVTAGEVQEHLGVLKRKQVIGQYSLDDVRYICEKNNWSYCSDGKGGYYSKQKSKTA